MKYIGIWKCSSLEFSELLDDAGAPLPKSDFPNYRAYLGSLRASLEIGTKDADFAFYVRLPIADMRREVERCGLPWGEGAWARVVDVILTAADRYAEDCYAAGARPGLDDLLELAWSRERGWLS